MMRRFQNWNPVFTGRCLKWRQQQPSRCHTPYYLRPWTLGLVLAWRESMYVFGLNFSSVLPLPIFEVLPGTNMSETEFMLFIPKPGSFSASSSQQIALRHRQWNKPETEELSQKTSFLSPLTPSLSPSLTGFALLNISALCLQGSISPGSP